MKGAEIRAATRALLSWFESQEITPADSCVVMTTALRSVIHMMAKDSNKSEEHGLDLVVRMIREDRV